MTGKKADVSGTPVPVVMTRTDIGKSTPTETDIKALAEQASDTTGLNLDSGLRRQ